MFTSLHPLSTDTRDYLFICSLPFTPFTLTLVITCLYAHFPSPPFHWHSWLLVYMFTSLHPLSTDTRDYLFICSLPFTPFPLTLVITCLYVHFPSPPFHWHSWLLVYMFTSLHPLSTDTRDYLFICSLPFTPFPLTLVITCLYVHFLSPPFHWHSWLLVYMFTSFHPLYTDTRDYLFICWLPFTPFPLTLVITCLYVHFPSPPFHWHSWLLVYMFTSFHPLYTDTRDYLFICWLPFTPFTLTLVITCLYVHFLSPPLHWHSWLLVYMFTSLHPLYTDTRDYLFICSLPFTPFTLTLVITCLYVDFPSPPFHWHSWLLVYMFTSFHPLYTDTRDYLFICWLPFTPFTLTLVITCLYVDFLSPPFHWHSWLLVYMLTSFHPLYTDTRDYLFICSLPFTPFPLTLVITCFYVHFPSPPLQWHSLLLVYMFTSLHPFSTDTRDYLFICSLPFTPFTLTLVITCLYVHFPSPPLQWHSWLLVYMFTSLHPLYTDARDYLFVCSLPFTPFPLTLVITCLYVDFPSPLFHWHSWLLVYVFTSLHPLYTDTRDYLFICWLPFTPFPLTLVITCLYVHFPSPLSTDTRDYLFICSLPFTPFPLTLVITCLYVDFPLTPFHWHSWLLVYMFISLPPFPLTLVITCLYVDFLSPPFHWHSWLLVYMLTSFHPFSTDTRDYLFICSLPFTPFTLTLVITCLYVHFPSTPLHWHSWLLVYMFTSLHPLSTDTRDYLFICSLPFTPFPLTLVITCLYVHFPSPPLHWHSWLLVYMLTSLHPLSTDTRDYLFICSLPFTPFPLTLVITCLYVHFPSPPFHWHSWLLVYMLTSLHPLSTDTRDYLFICSLPFTPFPLTLVITCLYVHFPSPPFHWHSWLLVYMFTSLHPLSTDTRYYLFICSLPFTPFTLTLVITCLYVHFPSPPLHWHSWLLVYMFTSLHPFSTDTRDYLFVCWLPFTPFPLTLVITCLYVHFPSPPLHWHSWLLVYMFTSLHPLSTDTRDYFFICWLPFTPFTLTLVITCLYVHFPSPPLHWHSWLLVYMLTSFHPLSTDTRDYLFICWLPFTPFTLTLVITCLYVHFPSPPFHWHSWLLVFMFTSLHPLYSDTRYYLFICSLPFTPFPLTLVITCLYVHFPSPPLHWHSWLLVYMFTSLHPLYSDTRDYLFICSLPFTPFTLTLVITCLYVHFPSPLFHWHSWLLVYMLTSLHPFSTDTRDYLFICSLPFTPFTLTLVITCLYVHFPSPPLQWHSWLLVYMFTSLHPLYTDARDYLFVCSLPFTPFPLTLVITCLYVDFPSPLFHWHSWLLVYVFTSLHPLYTDTRDYLFICWLPFTPFPLTLVITCLYVHFPSPLSTDTRDYLFICSLPFTPFPLTLVITCLYVDFPLPPFHWHSWLLVYMFISLPPFPLTLVITCLYVDFLSPPFHWHSWLLVYMLTSFHPLYTDTRDYLFICSLPFTPFPLTLVITCLYVHFPSPPLHWHSWLLVYMLTSLHPFSTDTRDYLFICSLPFTPFTLTLVITCLYVDFPSPPFHWHSWLLVYMFTSLHPFPLTLVITCLYVHFPSPPFHWHSWLLVYMLTSLYPLSTDTRDYLFICSFPFPLSTDSRDYLFICSLPFTPFPLTLVITCLYVDFPSPPFHWHSWLLVYMFTSLHPLSTDTRDYLFICSLPFTPFPLTLVITCLYVHFPSPPFHWHSLLLVYMFTSLHPLYTDARDYLFICSLPFTPFTLTLVITCLYVHFPSPLFHWHSWLLVCMLTSLYPLSTDTRDYLFICSLPFTPFTLTLVITCLYVHFPSPPFHWHSWLLFYMLTSLHPLYTDTRDYLFICSLPFTPFPLTLVITCLYVHFPSPL